MLLTNKHNNDLYNVVFVLENLEKKYERTDKNIRLEEYILEKLNIKKIKKYIELLNNNNNKNHIYNEYYNKKKKLLQKIYYERIYRLEDILMMFNELGEIYSNECEEKKFENILEEMLERSKIDIYKKELLKCNCCERHKNKEIMKKKNFNYIKDEKCVCPCRHIYRWLNRIN